MSKTILVVDDSGSFRTVVKLADRGSQLTQVPELPGTEAVVSQQLASLGFTPRPRYRWNGASATEGQVIAIEQASDGAPQLRREYGILLLSQFPNSDEARRLKQSK